MKMQVAGEEILIDEEDVDILRSRNWCMSEGYVRSSDRERVHLAREIVDAPKGKVVDHINGNPLDNRRENLRICSQADNARNCKPQSGTSKYKGVHWHKKGQKWCAQIKHNYELKYLGLYEDEEKAARAYDKAASELFGEYARLNFPEGADLVTP